MKIVVSSCLLFLLIGCVVSKPVIEKSNPPILKVVSHTLEDDMITLYLEIFNNTKDTISILKPRPLKRGNSFVGAMVPPDFFEVKLLNQNEPCVLTAPNDAGTSDIKTMTDILIIPPNQRVSMTLNCADYDAFYCGEEQLNIQINYKFDERLLDQAFFDKTIGNRGKLSPEKKAQLFHAITHTYQGELSTSATINNNDN